MTKHTHEEQEQAGTPAEEPDSSSADAPSSGYEEPEHGTTVTISRANSVTYRRRWYASDGWRFALGGESSEFEDSGAEPEVISRPNYRPKTEAQHKQQKKYKRRQSRLHGRAREQATGWYNKETKRTKDSAYAKGPYREKSRQNSREYYKRALARCEVDPEFAKEFNGNRQRAQKRFAARQKNRRALARAAAGNSIFKALALVAVDKDEHNDEDEDDDSDSDSDMSDGENVPDPGHFDDEDDDNPGNVGVVSV